MKHPLKFIPALRRKPLFWLFFALTLLILGIFQFLDRFLRTRAAPAGIITFEFARNTGEAVQIVSSWGFPARLNAAFGLGLDYLFMPVYALALGLGTLLAARQREAAPWQTLGSLLGWGVLLAAGCDALENVGLYAALQGYFDLIPAEVVFTLVSIKFTLLALAAIYSLAAWLIPQRK